jgi:hypothetical protein
VADHLLQLLLVLIPDKTEEGLQVVARRRGRGMVDDDGGRIGRWASVYGGPGSRGDSAKEAGKQGRRRSITDGDHLRGGGSVNDGRVIEKRRGTGMDSRMCGTSP